MPTQGPPIAALVRRLGETPAEFLAEPRSGSKGRIHVDAVVADLITDLGGALPAASEFAPFRAHNTKADRARLRLTLIAAWLLHDGWFRSHGGCAQLAFEFLTTGLGELAATGDPARFVNDSERSEELARLALRALGHLPEGETLPQAQDRLTTVSTLERQRVMRETRDAQERVRQVQEAMRRKQAEEAAAVYGRE